MTVTLIFWKNSATVFTVKVPLTSKALVGGVFGGEVNAWPGYCRIVIAICRSGVNRHPFCTSHIQQIAILHLSLGNTIAFVVFPEVFLVDEMCMVDAEGSVARCSPAIELSKLIRKLRYVIYVCR